MEFLQVLQTMVSFRPSLQVDLKFNLSLNILSSISFYFLTDVIPGGYKMKFHMRKINSDKEYLGIIKIESNINKMHVKLVRLEFSLIKCGNHVTQISIPLHANCKPVNQLEKGKWERGFSVKIVKTQEIFNVDFALKNSFHLNLRNITLKLIIQSKHLLISNVKFVI